MNKILNLESYLCIVGYINVMSDRSKYIEKKRDERDLEYTPRHPKPPRSERMEYEAEPREYQAQRYLFQPSLHTDQLHDQNHIDDVPIVEHRQNYRRQSTYQQQSEVKYSSLTKSFFSF